MLENTFQQIGSRRFLLHFRNQLHALSEPKQIFRILLIFFFLAGTRSIVLFSHSFCSYLFALPLFSVHFYYCSEPVELAPLGWEVIVELLRLFIILFFFHLETWNLDCCFKFFFFESVGGMRSGETTWLLKIEMRTNFWLIFVMIFVP